MYVAVCLRCKEKGIVAEYHGETGKSLNRRAQGHMEKLKSWDASNFMLRHNLQHHQEEDPQNASYLWYPSGF